MKNCDCEDTSNISSGRSKTVPGAPKQWCVTVGERSGAFTFTRTIVGEMCQRDPLPRATMGWARSCLREGSPTFGEAGGTGRADLGDPKKRVLDRLRPSLRHTSRGGRAGRPGLAGPAPRAPRTLRRRPWSLRHSVPSWHALGCVLVSSTFCSHYF